MRILLLFVAFFIHALLFGQQYAFIKYSNNVGLPQSQVQCITQDKQGYLWVGTSGGLARFNGKTFSTFALEEGLLSNRISSLDAIKEFIVVGHEGGISLIKNGKARHFSFNKSDRNILTKKIVLFQNQLVIATEGGGIYILVKNKLVKKSLRPEDAATCRDILVVNNKIIVATRNGLYQSNDLEHFVFIPQFGTKSVSGLCLANNRIYCATFTKGIFSCLLDFSKIEPLKTQFPNNYITGITSGKDNSVWLHSLEGLMCFKNDETVTTFTEQNGLPGNSINCAFNDKDGNMWFGSDGNGLLRFCGNSIYSYTTKNGLESDLVLSIARKNNEQYFLGTYDKGAFVMTKNGQTSKLKVPGSTVWDIEKIGTETWFATDVGLVQLTQSGKITTHNFDDNPATIMLIQQLKSGKNLVIGYNGIGVIKAGELIKIPVKNATFQYIGSIRQVIEYNGILLCASSKGLAQLSLEKKTINLIKFFSAGVNSLAIDALNRLWIGTENGLFVYNGINYKLIQIGKNSGAKFINFIEKKQETLFVGTNNGVYSFDCTVEKTKPLAHFGLNTGLISLESNINSAYCDGADFWFGTAEGLVCIKDANNTVFSNQQPKLNFRKLLINYQDIDLNDFTDEFDENGFPLSIRLPYNKNNISIELDGLLMRDPESILYQYWLEGLEPTWSPAIANPTIFLSNLPADSYKLHVRTIDELGNTSDEQLLLLEITPPFWQTWWFYLLILVSIGGIIRYYFVWKIKQVRENNYKENLENQTRLLALEQQSLNASMNRHFIFNSLNAIQYFINTQDKLSANRFLTNFAKLIRKNLDSAAENNNTVTLAQELERLELYLSLESMRFNERFSYAINYNNIDIDRVIVPGMLLQPFVENSIIHGILPNEAKKGIITVTIKLIKDQLEVCIDDNGIGIDFSLAKKQGVQGDHKSQGMEITSKRISLIRKMWKKDYELIGPFQVMDENGSINGTRVLIKIPYENFEN
jgi:ligand-binding sensor domain-containing protein/two-component sensor histidine kinase